MYDTVVQVGECGSESDVDAEVVVSMTDAGPSRASVGTSWR